jgi:hypothetical protein
MTCGGCKHYGNNSCYCPEAALSLLDDVYVTTPACEHFEPRTATSNPTTLRILAPQTRSKNQQPPDLSDWLSPETRAKLRPLGRATFLERSAEK